MFMLYHEAVLKAAHAVYAVEYAAVYQERFKRAFGGPAVTLEDCVPVLAEDLQAPIAYYLLGRVEQAWGGNPTGWCCTLGHIFCHANIYEEAEQVRALTALLHGCVGHEQTIFDEFGERLERLAESLKLPITARPIYAKPEEWRKLAEAEVGELDCQLLVPDSTIN